MEVAGGDSGKISCRCFDVLLLCISPWILEFPISWPSFQSGFKAGGILSCFIFYSDFLKNQTQCMNSMLQCSIPLVCFFVFSPPLNLLCGVCYNCAGDTWALVKCCTEQMVMLPSVQVHQVLFLGRKCCFSALENYRKDQVKWRIRQVWQAGHFSIPEFISDWGCCKHDIEVPRFVCLQAGVRQTQAYSQRLTIFCEQSNNLARIHWTVACQGCCSGSLKWGAGWARWPLSHPSTLMFSNASITTTTSATPVYTLRGTEGQKEATMGIPSYLAAPFPDGV